MKITASEAAKKVGKSVPTIRKAIKNGKLSAKKRKGKGWIIETSELFKIWPDVSNDSDVTSTTSGVKTDVLQAKINPLRETLDETKADRDRWREPVESQSTKPKGFWPNRLKIAKVAKLYNWLIKRYISNRITKG